MIGRVLMSKYSWLDCDEECKKWKQHKKAKIKVVTESFFNNANIILKHDNDFKEKLCSCINGEIQIVTKVRTVQRQKNKKKYSRKYRGIEIDFFNSELREKLKNNDSLLFEVYNEEGVFYTSNGKRGFDFAQLDNKYNLFQLWNQCFGKRALYNGEELWKDSLEQNAFLKEVADVINFSTFEKGKDVEVKKDAITILGELQFGNWGLVYRDLFKLLDADANSGVDLFVYITAHNKLLSYASDQIVSYDDTVKVLNEFSNLIKVPVWLIGLDIEI